MFQIAEKEVHHVQNLNLESIVTLVNVKMLDSILTESGYDETKKNFLLDGFKNGFSIGYEGNRKIKHTANNLRLEIGDQIDLWNKVIKEVKLNRYAGPFPEIPFEYYIQSPINLVPKDNGKNMRLIFHLSHPRNGKCESVNANTPYEKCRVTYPDFNEAVKRCLDEGVGCSISLSDFSAAFRNLRIRRLD